jgi:YfiH family protein
MAHWQWKTWQGNPFLTCALLQSWPHGFFTRQFWPHSPELLVDALHPDGPVYRVKQVHGNTVLSPADLPLPQPDLEPPPRAEADALVSDGAGQSLWVCTADCSPVLIGDRKSGQVAAIHAGWRGTAQGIVPVAIRRMMAAGSDLENLVVAIGPAIAGEVYQVSTEVGAAVGRTILHSPTGEDQLATEDELIVDQLLNMPDSPLLADPEPQRVRLDVRRVNLLQLTQLGIPHDRVAIAPHCTFQQPDQFFSYRRTGEKKVQWSGIVSR